MVIIEETMRWQTSGGDKWFNDSCGVQKSLKVTCGGYWPICHAQSSILQHFALIMMYEPAARIIIIIITIMSKISLLLFPLFVLPNR